jgi:hypothetical protein
VTGRTNNIWIKNMGERCEGDKENEKNGER